MSNIKSEKPITPRPIFLVCLVTSSIFGIGYLLISMTLSRKCIARAIVFSSLDQSIPSLPSTSLVISTRLIEPRLQLSYGRSGCSPHGFVASIGPCFGRTLNLFILSIKTIPGSPLFHALSTILLYTILAGYMPTTLFVDGSIRS